MKPKKIKIFAIIIGLIIILPVIIFNGLYWIGIKALPDNHEPISQVKYNHKVCKLFWADLGGVGAIRMEPIRFWHYIDAFCFSESLDDSMNPMPANSQLTSIVAKMLLLKNNHTELNRWHINNFAVSVWVRHWSGKEAINSLAEWSYYGHGFYGFSNAAQGYFNKSQNDLDINEIALLVGIIKSPTRFSPWCSPSRTLKQMNRVLGNYYSKNGVDFESLKSLPLSLIPPVDGVCEDNKSGV